MSSRADLDEDESANQPLSVQEHISQDGSSDDLSDNETFNKKGGTTNVGHEYEDLQVAKIIIKLLKHKNISNFKIWSNDENFGKFDDVILKFLTTNKKVYRFAIQVKHSESKKKLSNKVLAGLTGDDHSINIYFQDYRQFKKDAQIIQDNFKLILLTSKTTYAIWEEEFKFGEDFTLKANPVRDPFALVTGNQNLGTAFQFSIQEVHTGDDQLHKDFEEFLEKFYVYPYQDHVKKTKFLVAEEFNELFKTNTSHKFLDFIKNWSEMTGNKRKLSKSFISDKVSELLLSAFIVQPNFSPPDIECEENEKKLLKAISQFDRTFIEATDFNQANPNYNKYPSIVSVTQANVGTVSKALELIDAEKKEKKKIIFLGASKDFNGLSHLPDVELFRNLNDLKAKDETLYQEIATTFTLSLQGKQTIALSKILYDDRSRQNITPSHLLRMLEGHLLIGGPAEELPKYYIPLSMSDMFIDCNFIIDVDAVPSMNAKVLVACHDISKFVDEYKDLQYIKMDEKFEMSQMNVHVCKEHLAKKCFQTLSKLNSSFNCHLFEYRENEHALKWLESTDAVNHLLRYHLKQEYAISENDVSKESYKINIICDEPGMGKSCFLDKLKNIYDPTYRVIRIEPKTHAIFRCQLSDQELDNYLKNVDCNVKTEMEKFLLKYLYDNGRFVILWDALDEVSDEKLPHVLDAIKYFKGKGIQQWLTSRNVLREKLEVTFVVLARNIVKFDENQQKSYIKRRLKDCYPTNWNDIAENIMNNLKSYSVNELLGIPIQISMLTELFMGPDSKLILEKMSSNLFSIATLYEHVLEGKFKFHSYEKTEFEKNQENDAAAVELQESKEFREEHYEKAALKARLEDHDFNELNMSCDDFLGKLQKGDRYGIIIGISNNIPNFFHITFAEYLAAKYLCKNYKNVPTLTKWLFKERNKSLRLFFDTILAGDSELHIAVLYKNIDNVIKLLTIEKKDKGGRNPLHLACSWGTPHFPLKIEQRSGRTLIKDENAEAVQEEKREQIHICEELLKFYKPCEEDTIFKFNTFSYIENTCSFAMLDIVMQSYTEEVNNFNDMTSLLYSSIKFKYMNIINWIKVIPNVVISDHADTWAHLAARHNNGNFLKWLEKKPNKSILFQKNGQNETPLDIARKCGFEEIDHYLTEIQPAASTITLNKVDPPNSNQTFRIRPGTIDLGIDYECLCLSHTIIRLLSNREVVDFQAWTNDAQFGYFDDIIVDVHMQDGSHNKFAMQLKHSDSRRNMPFRKADFESVTGMLCVNRFFQSFRECRLVLHDCTLIIQTNRKGPENWNETITFENKVMLKIHQADEDPMATSIGPSRNRPFKFSIVSYLPETEQKLLEDLNDFLSRFYLYVQQPDVSEIENLINTDFNQLFATSENAWKTFVDFIREWSKIRGRKLKLTRNFMCSKVIEQLLRPFISVFSSQRASSNPKRDLLKNAVLQFHKTWVDTQNTADLEKLTSGIQAETLLDEMIQLNKKFLITSSYFRDLTDLDQKDISIFLWYLNQFPLVVSITPDNINIVRKVFELNVEDQEQGKNFVLVGSKELCEGLISSDDFRSLHDLWIKDQNLYEEITANFTASLVGRSPVPLKSIVNDAIKKCIPPSHLLQMLDGPMTIGEISRETIPYYDGPYFTDFIIDGSFLTTEISDTVILIICENPAGIKSKFCDASFAEFNKGTEEDKHLSSRIWLLPSTDYCESAFHKLNKLNKKYHLLEFIEQDGDLKWMKSNKNMDDLRHYLCKNRKPIPENEVLKTNRPINIIYEETGIYKSRLSTILEKSNKELFEVIEIDVSKDPFFKNTRTPEELNDYLTNAGFSASKSDIELVIALRKYYFLNNNVIIVWDVLEELFFVDLLNVFDTIKHYTTVTAHQWIITKSRFVEVFENRLHVLSRSILPLDEHQQITYLHKRLSQKYTGTVLNEVVGKMTAYLKSNEISRKMSADIQQMFLLTERILNDDSVMNVIP